MSAFGLVTNSKRALHFVATPTRRPSTPGMATVKIPPDAVVRKAAEGEVTDFRALARLLAMCFSPEMLPQLEIPSSSSVDPLADRGGSHAATRRMTSGELTRAVEAITKGDLSGMVLTHLRDIVERSISLLGSLSASAVDGSDRIFDVYSVPGAVESQIKTTGEAQGKTGPVVLTPITSMVQPSSLAVTKSVSGGVDTKPPPVADGDIWDRKLSAKRSAYSAADLTHLLRCCVSNDPRLMAKIFDQFAPDGRDRKDIKLSFAEFSGAMRSVVDQDLKPKELQDLYDTMDTSHDELRLDSFVNFFTSPEMSASLSVSTGNTITTVALCAAQTFVAVGGIDCTVKIYDLRPASESSTSGSIVFDHKFPKQVGAVCLSADGRFVGVGMFGGQVQWHDSHSPGGADAAARFTWEHKKDINSLAVNASDTELAAGGADCAVTIYSLKTGRVRFRFLTLAPVWSVALADSAMHTLELEDGTVVENIQGITFAPGSQAGSWKDVILTGHIIQKTDEAHLIDATYALHALLESAQAKLKVLIVVVASIIVSYLPLTGLIAKENGEKLEYLFSLIFLIEVIVRLYCHQHIDSRIMTYFSDPYATTDFLIVVADIATLLAGVVGVTFSNIELYRGLRLARLVKLFRDSRAVSRLGEKDKWDNNFDVRMKNGTIIPQVPQRCLIASDAKACFEMMTAVANRKRRQKSQIAGEEATMTRPNELNLQSPTGKGERRQSTGSATVLPTQEIDGTDRSNTVVEFNCGGAGAHTTSSKNEESDSSDDDGDVTAATLQEELSRVVISRRSLRVASNFSPPVAGSDSPSTQDRRLSLRTSRWNFTDLGTQDAPAPKHGDRDSGGSNGYRVSGTSGNEHKEGNGGRQSMNEGASFAPDRVEQHFIEGTPVEIQLKVSN